MQPPIVGPTLGIIPSSREFPEEISAEDGRKVPDVKPEKREIIDRVEAVIPKSGIYGRPIDAGDTNELVVRTDGRSGPVPQRNRSRSPLPPKVHYFSGDPEKESWRSFIFKLERLADRRGWDNQKKLDWLFDCLSDTALEYANRCEGKGDYDSLKAELQQRFDLRDTPVAARQKLHSVKQKDEETLEVYLQRVLTISMDGFGSANAETLQHIATEAFLRGAKTKRKPPWL